MPALRSLDIRRSGFGDDGVAELLGSLLVLNSLAEIRIGGNGVSEAAMKIFKAAFNRPGRTPPTWL